MEPAERKRVHVDRGLDFRSLGNYFSFVEQAKENDMPIVYSAKTDYMLIGEALLLIC